MNNEEDVMTIKDLTLMILDDWSDFNDITVGCIAGYEVIKQLLTEMLLVMDGSLELDFVELTADIMDDYILNIHDNEVSVERLHREEGYRKYYSDILWVDGDINSKVLQKCDNEDVFVEDFTIGQRMFRDQEPECNGDCCDCPECCTEDLKEFPDEMNGFTFTKTGEHGSSTYSFYSSNEGMVSKALEGVLRDIF